MRFRTRDLLLLTTIVACYAAMLVPFLQKQQLDMSFRPRFAWILALGFACSLLRACLGRRAFARTAERFRRSRMTWLHLAPIAALLIAIIKRDPALGSYGFWGTAAILVLTHVSIEVASHILVGEEGIVPTFDLLRWKDYDFTVERNQLVCALAKNPHKLPPKRYTLWRDDAEALHKLLGEKRATEDSSPEA